MAREKKAIREVKREMRNFIMNYVEGRYPDWKFVQNALTRIYGFTQGIIVMDESAYIEVSNLWEKFRSNIYVWEGVYQEWAWSRIDGVFEQRL